jgi:hypothetical protein
MTIYGGDKQAKTLVGLRSLGRACFERTTYYTRRGLKLRISVGWGFPARQNGDGQECPSYRSAKTARGEYNDPGSGLRRSTKDLLALVTLHEQSG